MSGLARGSVSQDSGRTVTAILGLSYVVRLAGSCAPFLDLSKERCEILEHSGKSGDRLPG